MKTSEKSIPGKTLDPEQLRSAMRAWTAGVTIVAAAHEGVRHGMTVNSFTSISLDPAWITISLQQTSRTHALIHKSGVFGITILGLDQKDLADRFAGLSPELEDRFVGLATETYQTGAPLIKSGLAHLDCRVIQSILVGMNTLFIAEVVSAHTREAGPPLIYHNRGYWKLTDL